MQNFYAQEGSGMSNWSGQGNFGLASGGMPQASSNGDFAQHINDEASESDSDSDSDSESEIDPKEETADPKYLENYVPKPYQGIIADESAWNAARQRLEDLIAARPTEFYATSDPVSDKKWVRKMFDAIHNMDKIVDKPCKGGKVCQAGQRIMSGYYPAEAIEKACWDVLNACRTAAMGIRHVEPHHNAKFEIEHHTFKGRMKKIVKAFRKSKALCKQLLDPPFLHRLADAPVYELKAKHQNKKINTERDIQNHLGRELLKLEDGVKASGEGSPEDEEGGVSLTFSTPIKTFGKNLGSRKRSSTLKTSANVTANSNEMSTTKRKRFGGLNIDQEDGEVEDGGGNDVDYLETPVKPKRVRGQHITKLNLSPTSATRINKQISTARSKSTRGIPSAKKVKAVSSLHVSRDIRGERERKELEYKELVCDLLAVPRDLATSYNLAELRFYVRAYNIEFVNQQWEFTDNTYMTGTYHGKYHYIYMGSRVFQHFAEVIKHFRPLAVARNDLNPDFSFNQQSADRPGLDVKAYPELYEALGLVHNGFGISKWSPASPVVSPVAEMDPHVSHDSGSSQRRDDRNFVNLAPGSDDHSFNDGNPGINQQMGVMHNGGVPFAFNQNELDELTDFGPVEGGRLDNLQHDHTGQGHLEPAYPGVFGSGGESMDDRPFNPAANHSNRVMMMNNHGPVMFPAATTVYSHELQAPAHFSNRAYPSFSGAPVGQNPGHFRSPSVQAQIHHDSDAPADTNFTPMNENFGHGQPPINAAPNNGGYKGAYIDEYDDEYNDDYDGGYNGEW